MDDRTETGLALDDNIGDTHLAAEGGEEDNQLNGVDVVGDQDEGGLLVLDEANNVVQTELGGVGLLGDILLLLALGDGGSLLGKALLLLGLGLRAVLVKDLECLGGDCDALARFPRLLTCICLRLRSATCWNWAIAGGTFKRRLRIFFWRWRRTYAGHLTMRPRLRWGWMSWPIPKFLGRFSRRGFCDQLEPEKSFREVFQRTLAAFLLPAFPWGKGAGAVFFPLGGILYCRGSVIENRNYQRMFIH